MKWLRSFSVVLLRWRFITKGMCVRKPFCFKKSNVYMCVCMYVWGQEHVNVESKVILCLQIIFYLTFQTGLWLIELGWSSERWNVSSSSHACLVDTALGAALPVLEKHLMVLLMRAVPLERGRLSGLSPRACSDGQGGNFILRSHIIPFP